MALADAEPWNDFPVAQQIVDGAVAGVIEFTYGEGETRVTLRIYPEPIGGVVAEVVIDAPVGHPRRTTLYGTDSACDLTELGWVEI